MYAHYLGIHAAVFSIQECSDIIESNISTCFYGRTDVDASDVYLERLFVPFLDNYITLSTFQDPRQTLASLVKSWEC